MEAPDYRVGRFTLKPFRQLLDGGVPVQIGRKPLELLSVLAKAEGDLVTKDELMAAVWPKSIVEENVIQVHIAALRKTLGKDAELICTVHGLGYRLTVVPETSVAVTAGNPAENQARGTRPDLAPGRGARFVLAGVAIAFIAVVAMVSYWARDNSPGGPGMVTETAPAVHAPPITVAVLPFDNLSGDLAQQFFSDGVAVEITGALAKVAGLQVVARNSADQFRGKRDARQAGAALNARYIIEGSVRKENNRIRITAQLVRTDTGLAVWSNSYARELTDIFVIQEEVATAIVEALRLPLGLAPGKALVSSRNIDRDSYEQFLRARPLVRARQTGIPQAIAILQPLVARNPGYAPAWALLARCYSGMPAMVSPYTMVPGRPDTLQRRQRIDEYWPKAEDAARRSIQLDPELADGYTVFGTLRHLQGRLAEADDFFAKALTLDSNNPDALGARMNLLANVGQLGKAREIAEKLLALEPYVPTWKQDAAEILWQGGQEDRAVKLLTSIIERPSVPSTLAMIYSSQQRYSKAADVMENALKARGELGQGQTQMWRTAINLLRIAPEKAPFGGEFPRLGRVGFVYLHVGAPDQALQIYEDEVRTGLVGGQTDFFGFLWHPSFAVVRKTERFKTLMKNARMVEYWQQRGWPDYCRPAGDADFVCS